jgi:hypothetical protein
LHRHRIEAPFQRIGHGTQQRADRPHPHGRRGLSGRLKHASGLRRTAARRQAHKIRVSWVKNFAQNFSELMHGPIGGAWRRMPGSCTQTYPQFLWADSD